MDWLKLLAGDPLSLSARVLGLNDVFVNSEIGDEVVPRRVLGSLVFRHELPVLVFSLVKALNSFDIFVHSKVRHGVVDSVGKLVSIGLDCFIIQVPGVGAFDRAELNRCSRTHKE